jgi:hypothetical protein
MNSNTTVSLKAIRQVIRQESVRQLPDYVPSTVYEYFINKFVSQWTFICLESFREVEELLKQLLDVQCAEHFGRFQSSGLLREVRFYPVLRHLVLGKLRRRFSNELLRKQETKSGFTAKWNVVDHLH